MQRVAGMLSFMSSDITGILSAIEQGDPHAAAQLLPLVYDELRKLAAQRLAQEKPGQTLEATALSSGATLVPERQIYPTTCRSGTTTQVTVSECFASSRSSGATSDTQATPPHVIKLMTKTFLYESI